MPNFRNGLGVPPSQMTTPLAVDAWPFVGGGHPIVAKLGRVRVRDSPGLFHVKGIIFWASCACKSPWCPLGFGLPRFLQGYG